MSLPRNARLNKLRQLFDVIPAEAGIQRGWLYSISWIPAFAGMTRKGCVSLLSAPFRGTLLLIGVVDGILGGLLGIGGGAILVPLLVRVLRMAQHQAHGTSLTVVVFIALSGALGYAWQGKLDWSLILPMGAGAIVGVVVGARLMMRVPAPLLRRGFGVFLILLGLFLLLRPG